MLSHILKRLVLAVPVIWGVVTIVFVLTRALPGDPAETMLSQSGGSPQAVEQLRAQRLRAAMTRVGHALAERAGIQGGPDGILGTAGQ